MRFNTRSGRRLVVLLLAIVGLGLMAAFAATSEMAFGVAGIAAWTGLLIAVLMGVRYRAGVALASLDRISSALEDVRAGQADLQRRIEAGGEQSRRFHMRSMERFGFLGKEYLARLDSLAARIGVLSADQAALAGRVEEERENNSRFRARIHDKLGSQARDHRARQAALQAMFEQVVQQHRDAEGAAAAARRALIDVETLILRAFADVSENLEAARLESTIRLDAQGEQAAQAGRAIAALDGKLSGIASQAAGIISGLQDGDFTEGVRSTVARLEAEVRASREHMVSLFELEAKGRGERLHSVEEAFASQAREVAHGLASIRSRLDDDVAPSLAGVQPKIDGLVARTEELFGKDGRALQAVLRRGADWLRYETVQEIEALQRLRDRLHVGADAPLLGGWAMDPTAMLYLVNHVLDGRPGLIVECGSGASTVWLAKALEANGGGRLVALEHDPVYAQQTRAALVHHNVEKFVDLRLAEIGEVDLEGKSYPWYVNAMDGIDGVDVLLVDGPPKRIGPLARYPALPLIADRLKRNALVMVDDYNREEEQKMVGLWHRRFPELGPSTKLAGARAIVCFWKADSAEA